MPAVQLREFTTGAEMMAHYAAIQARRRAVVAPPEKPRPEPKAAPVSQPVAKATHHPSATMYLQADEWFPSKERPAGPPTVSKIINIVSWQFKVSRLDLISPSRRSRFAMPRQIAMYLIRRFTARSLTETGAVFGGRDHSTVLHAVAKISRLRADDQDLRLTLAVIEKELAA